MAYGSRVVVNGSCEKVVRQVTEALAEQDFVVVAELNLRETLQTSLGVAMPDQFSSTAQDMARRKPTEIDHLNGFVARRGRERGVATPVNQTLHALVKLIEAGYGGAA